MQEGKEEDWKIGRVEERNVGRWEGREVETQEEELEIQAVMGPASRAFKMKLSFKH